jgi:7-cyano-7-deazaguanine synthase
MDSCVVAAVAAQEFRLGLLHISYGQRTETKELQCFHGIADALKPERRLVLRFDHFKAIGGSSLTDRSIDVPSGEPLDGQIPSTYVPFRNAGFLSAAVSWGETVGAEAVFIGAVEEDSSGYPDCREVFLSAFQETVNNGIRPDHVITIKAPLLHMTKDRIIRLGASLGAPFHLTWSCYRQEDHACGTCASCLLRRSAFARAEIIDPIPYQQGEPQKTP